ncbi:MAG TPA: hypothetical protein VL832_00430 [Puia sp.]|jgi:hypothetical protein|nr:hypothetical protein [Puia sp.]
MKNMEEPTPKKSSSRRKFVGGVGLLSVISALAAVAGLSISGKKNVISCAPETAPGRLPDGEKKMVRMLTEDGKLVEIEASRLPARGEKISNDELQHWIKT